MFATLASLFLASSVWTASWIGPAPETRPDEDFGPAEWIVAPADDRGVSTLDFVFDCPAIPSDEAVEMVHAGAPEYEIEVNGKLFYKWRGHVRDVRYPLFRDLRPWLAVGRNTVRVRLTGKGERQFSILRVFVSPKRKGRPVRLRFPSRRHSVKLSSSRCSCPNSTILRLRPKPRRGD